MNLHIIKNRNEMQIKFNRTFFYLLIGVAIGIFSSTTTKAQLVAFPGAEGYGRYTTGGRGGAVYEVTNLKDDGSIGSLRWAVNQSGKRTIVFKVSGNIPLKDYLKISKGDVTIAGQTAPGDGICLSNYTLSVQANNVIIRFIRSRLGDTTIVRDSSGKPKLNSLGLPLHVEDDAAHGMGTYSNIIIDHCSFSWSIDEAASFYDNNNFTMQWCIISESLYRSYHSKGNHGYGGIWGGMGATFHHNLLAHNSSRNPRFCGARYHQSTASTEVVDLVNNVIYNWGFNSVYGGELGSQNVRLNYYKPGPATKSSVRNRILNPTIDSGTNSGLGKFYVADNYVDGSLETTADNWGLGVQGVSDAQKTQIKVTTPFPIAPLTEQTPQDAYNSVLQFVGDNYPKRDTIDSRIINETRTGTVTYGGKGYPLEQNMDTSKVYGIIDSQSQVGGWPVLNSTTPPVDSDHDGMPDDWEVAHGLDPNNPADRNNLDSSGYTMLEVYLNGLVSNSIISSVRNETAVPDDFLISANFPNPFNPATTIQYSIPHGGNVRIKIFDSIGKEVRELYSGYMNAGTHNVRWNSKDNSGKNAASGVYIFSITYNGLMKSIKLVLLK